MWSPDQDLHESIKENYHKIESSSHGKWYGPCTPTTVARSNSKSPRESPRLSLALFAKTPRVSFGKVKIGNTKVKRVVVENPSDIAQSLQLDKWPEKKGFMVLMPVEHGDSLCSVNDGLEVMSRSSDFTVSAVSEVDLPILWKPDSEGSFRETITLKLGDFNRLHIIVFGNAIDTSVKPKQKMKTLLPEDVRRGNCAQKRKISLTNGNTTSKKVLQESNKGLPQPKVTQVTAFDVRATAQIKPTKEETKVKGKTSKQTFKMKVAAKGIAPSRLRLIKKSTEKARNIPRHPLPFAAKNMYFDEKWIEKQERGFVQWLNFILTPPDELTTSVLPEHSSIFVMDDCDQEHSQPLAPTKEDLSLRIYTAKRMMTRLRRSACLLYQSQPVAIVARTIECEVEKNRLCIRPDKHFHRDLGIKETILKMLLSYNSLWLRIGIETVYGEILPLQSNNDTHGLKRFLKNRFLANPDIAKEYRHATVAEYYRPGYYEALQKFTLKKFLLLVLFLDKAKLTRLIDHDPCLFNKDAKYKCSRDLLLAFSRDYLKGEGDVTKHLSMLNYTVSHVQVPLDEMDYAVENLAVDLRDGLRITRVIELLTQNWTLSSNLRVPAISRLQKIHNVGVALNALKDRGVFEDEKNTVDSRHIVDGHREKTLSFLWSIISHFQVNLVVNERQLKEEISFLQKYHRIRNLGRVSGMPRRESSDGQDVYSNSEKLSLLLEWCRSVCRLYGVKVDNFTVSMSDGRVLCYLLHYYHPCLVREEDICQETTQTCNPYTAEDENASDSLIMENWVSSHSKGYGGSTRLQELKENERRNHELCRKKVQELGGVPSMLKFTDMSSTIPDEKVVITYTSYLCARLLDLKDEVRAARTIQLAWRRHCLRQHAKELKRKTEAVLVIQKYLRQFLEKKRQEVKLHSTVIIQAFFRGYQARRDLRRRHHAATMIQTSYRSFTAMRRIQCDYRKLKEATLKMQALVRSNLTRRYVKRMKAARVLQSYQRRYLARRDFLLVKNSTIILQSHTRKFQASRRYRALKMKTIAIQRRFRALKLGRETQREYTELKKVVTMVQARRRGIMGRRRVARLRATIVIQKSVRMWRCRREFLEKKKAAVEIQSHVRRNLARRRHCKCVASARVIQQHWRAYQLGKAERNTYRKLKASTVAMQAGWRSRVARKNFVAIKRAAIRIQTLTRGFLVRKGVKRWTMSCCVIQKYFRSYRLMKETAADFRKKKQAVVRLQAFCRGSTARVRYLRERKTVMLVQTKIRGYLVRKKYLQMKAASCVIQKHYRALNVMRVQREAYVQTRDAVVTLQASWRGHVLRRQLSKMNIAATLIQSTHRGHAARSRYLHVQRCVAVIQKRYRAWSGGRQTAGDYKRLRNAVIVIQKYTRGFKVRKTLKTMSKATVVIQANFRRYLGKKSYSRLRRSVLVIQRGYRSLCQARATRQDYVIKRACAIRLQSSLRRFLCEREFKRKKTAARVIQCRWRSVLESRRTREEYHRVRNSVITIQAAARGLQARRRVKKERAAISLQSRWRGLVQRQAYLKQRDAVVRVQSCFRMIACRREYVMFKKHVVFLQRLVRANQCCRRQVMTYGIIRGAVITLQAAVRGHSARKELQRMRKSAVRIQCCFRRHFVRLEYLKMRENVLLLQRRRRATVISRRARAEYRDLKRSTILLQARVRGRIGRREFEESRGKLVSLQATIRGFLAQSRYQRMRKAAIVIQQRYRSYRVGSTVYYWYNLQRGACITLQACVRAWILRRRYQKLRKAARVIEVYYRANCAAKKERSDYLAKRSAIISMQAFARGWAVRRQLQRSRAATCIQSWWKMCVVRREYGHKRECIVHAQSLVRAWLCRKRYRIFLHATTVVQRRFRANQLCRKERELFLEKKGSCLLIQHSYRFYRQRCLVLNLLRSVSGLRSAASVVQRRYRANCLMKRTRQSYLITRGAIITLQAAHRGYLARVNVARIRAAIVLQSHYRRYREQAEYLRLKSAVITMQALTRRKQACAEYRKLRAAAVVIQRRERARVQGIYQRKAFLTQKSSAILIQSCVRGYQERVCYKRLRTAAIKIQALARGRLGRNAFRRLRKATVVIQGRERARILGTSQRKLFLKQKKSAVLIQSSLRGRRERMRFLSLKNAVTRIQALVRGKRERVAFESLRVATIVIQRRERARVIGISQRNLFLKQRKSAVLIQSYVRGYQEKIRYERHRHAIIRIQARARGRRACLAYRRLREAAAVIQRRERARVLRDCERKRFLTQRNGAVLIQNWLRGHLVRQEYLQLRYATVKIQAWVKGHHQRRHYVTMQMAAVCIQRHYKAHILGRKILKRYQEIRNTTITLQSIYRGNCARRFVKRVRAAITIQSAFRRHIRRTWYLNLTRATLRLQATQKMRKEQRKYQELRYFAIQMQRRLRGNQMCSGERVKYQQLKSGVVRLQALYRGWKARQHIRRMKSARMIQRHYRARAEGRRTRADFLRVRIAAVTVQSWYRGHVARQHFKHERAARTIQAHVRGYQVRRKVEEIRRENAAKIFRFSAAVYVNLMAIRLQRTYRKVKAIALFKARMDRLLFLQRWWRARMQRLHYLKVKHLVSVIQRTWRGRLASKNQAATKIQARARAVLAKRTADRRKKAIVTIQSFWRGYVARKRCNTTKIKKVRKRIQVANARVTESMKLCNRMRSALDYLLKCKNLTTVHGALVNLEVASRLSNRCAEQLVMDNALSVIFEVVRNSNRSLAHIELIKHALAIFINVSKCPTTQGAVVKREPNSLDTLVELTCIFREKPDIFLQACVLLATLCQDESIRQELLLMEKAVSKLKSVYTLTKRKHDLDMKRNNSKSKRLSISSHKTRNTKNNYSVAATPLSAITTLVEILGLVDIL